MASIVIAGAQAVGTFVASNPQLVVQAAAAGLQYALAPDINQQFEGPRLQETSFLSATEGSPILRVYGRYRVGGQVIWMTRFEEEIVTETVDNGGGKGGPSNTTETTTYNYYANFAVGLCEGVTGSLGRVWFDGKEADMSKYNTRFYTGTDDQNPDPLIQAKEGVDNAPGYRGLSYVVFERMPLADFGNRIPQLMFEIYRPITDDGVEGLIKGVNLIPGSTEFGYDTEAISRTPRPGVAPITENAHLVNGQTDIVNSLDELESIATNLNVVCLVVAWFGNDLRCGFCEIKPGVENREKVTAPHSWIVSGKDRRDSDIHLISENDGGPAYGGTPNDASVIRAIQELKSRGHKVMMYPFILMDIPSDNTLPDPYTDSGTGVGQALYPWRGRITCSPAPGFTGTSDKTSAAAGQVDNFYGTAVASDFSGSSGTTVDWDGPSNEWSFSRFVLHMSKLCDLAGGVDYFCIGTEMIGMTTVRNTQSNFPFVNKLRDLAGEVRTMLGSSVGIGYAADWSEYHSYRPTDGSNDVYFNLDPLWADSDIDFIGIDNYLPLSDWREGSGHLDLNNFDSIYDVDYLKSNVEGGENYDWFYASQEDRDTQTRTPITDGQGKPWVFRNKDIKNWWANDHYNRPGGTESGSSTGWNPQSKPIFFTELGCPAIDKGSNQPNVFFDPKSAESAVPHYSNATRDDSIQRKYIQAQMEYWIDGSNNPTSSVYSSSMINTDTVCIWSWDARPWPSFPGDTLTWADAANWARGHWINNRLGSGVYIPDLLDKLAIEYEFTDYDFRDAVGTCDGYVLNRVMSLRAAIQPLEQLFSFDVIESGSEVKAVSRHNNTPVATIDVDNVLLPNEGLDLVKLTRVQEIDLPRAIRIGYIDSQSSYKSAKVEAKRLTGFSQRTQDTNAPIITDFARAQQMVNRLLYTAWGSREIADFGSLPSLMHLEAGDVVTLDVDGFNLDLRLSGATDGVGRNYQAFSFDATALTNVEVSDRAPQVIDTTAAAAPITYFLDLPLLTESQEEYVGYVATHANPFPGTVSLLRSVTDTNFAANTALNAPARIGETLTDFAEGPTGRRDFGNTLDVEIYRGALSSTDELSMLEGSNAMALRNTSGDWEIIQFQNAQLIGTRQYRLSNLLRGQLGTEGAMETLLPTSAPLVMLDLAVYPVSMSRADVNREFNYKSGPSGEPLSSPLYVDTAHTYKGIGMRPYSPAGTHMIRDSNSDLLIYWKRRTRTGGDSWEVDEVPLEEDAEQYRLRIYDGSTVVQEAVVSTPEYVYTSADQVTDFGSNQTQLIIELSQYGQDFGGYGQSRKETYTIIGAR